LNEFANNALRFTGVRKSSESSIELTIGKRDLTKAEALCIQSMSSLTVLSKKDCPIFFYGLKKDTFCISLRFERPFCVLSVFLYLGN
jgi:hypothetical protein